MPDRPDYSSMMLSVDAAKKWAADHGIGFVSHNRGTHWKFHVRHKVCQYWPETGSFSTHSTGKKSGHATTLEQLFAAVLKHLKHLKPSAIAPVVEKSPPDGIVEQPPFDVDDLTPEMPWSGEITDVDWMVETEVGAA